MGIARVFARALLLMITAYISIGAAMVAWTFLWPEPDLTQVAPADAILCLGGGMDADGTLAPAVLTRIDRCMEAYNASLAPIIIFSGGIAAPDGPSAGAQMARYAQSIGLPPEHGVVEGRAQSTLQNALFSIPLAQDAHDYIIVTEAFHLPRAWASFQWAWWVLDKDGPVTIQLMMSEPVRTNLKTGAPNWRMLGRESLAIWFNAARATLYMVAPNPPMDWLH